MTLGELVMGQALHDLRLVFADENDHTCGTLPDGLAAAVELRMEPAADGAGDTTTQMLSVQALHVRAATGGLAGMCRADLPDTRSRTQARKQTTSKESILAVGQSSLCPRAVTQGTSL